MGRKQRNLGTSRPTIGANVPAEQAAHCCQPAYWGWSLRVLI